MRSHVACVSKHTQNKGGKAASHRSGRHRKCVKHNDNDKVQRTKQQDTEFQQKKRTTQEPTTPETQGLDFLVSTTLSIAQRRRQHHPRGAETTTQEPMTPEARGSELQKSTTFNNGCPLHHPTRRRIRKQHHPQGRGRKSAHAKEGRQGKTTTLLFNLLHFMPIFCDL